LRPRPAASWSILTRWRGLTGSFSAPSLKSALRLAVRASNRPRQKKSKKAVTGDILAKLGPKQELFPPTR
jgi:hypothetical protein